eukprot:g34840.t1
MAPSLAGIYTYCFKKPFWMHLTNSDTSVLLKPKEFQSILGVTTSLVQVQPNIEESLSTTYKAHVRSMRKYSLLAQMSATPRRLKNPETIQDEAAYLI